MKKIKSFFVVLIATFVFGGCNDDFLNTEPMTQKTEPFYFQNQLQAYEALIGCYSGLLNFDNTSYSWWHTIILADMLSDDGEAGSATGIGLEADVVDRFDIKIYPTSQNIYKAHWIAAWVAIARVNKLLSKLDEIDWTQMNGGQNLTKEQCEGEVKVLRALIYFNLVRLVGNIPLITEKTVDILKEPQSDPKFVYGQIMQDLKDATTLLPSNPYSKASSTGRMTKWGAQALAARVYLYYNGYYGKTQKEIPLGIGKGSVDKAGLITYVKNILPEDQIKTYLTEIINNGGFSLVPNFQSLWPTGSAEAKKRDRNFPGYVGEGNPETVMTEKATYLANFNNGFSKWPGFRQVNSDSVYGTGWGVGLPHAHVWDLFNEKDSRKSATLLNLMQERGTTFYNLVKSKDQRAFNGFYWKKYYPMNNKPGLAQGTFLGGAGWSDSWYQDFVLIRYADVLLMAAEMGINAQSNFDKVRVRAYGQDYVNANSLPPTFENIMAERRLEFMGEGIRYFDLLRQGVEKAAQSINIPAPGLEVFNGPDIYGSKNIIIDGNNVLKTSGLIQIPWDAIDLSDGLYVQNVGWEKY
jgi:hypothetical protein